MVTRPDLYQEIDRARSSPQFIRNSGIRAHSAFGVPVTARRLPYRDSALECHQDLSEGVASVTRRRIDLDREGRLRLLHRTVRVREVDDHQAAAARDQPDQGPG